jgi:hypothetical protein
VITDPREWAEELFGECDLGDPRRTARLIDYAARQAVDPKGSTSQVCSTSAAAAEGAYRMLRNESIDAEAMALGMYTNAAKLAVAASCVLAIEDTTSVSVHSAELRAELAENGCPSGFVVHNVLLVDFEHSEVLGLIDQTRTIRDRKRPGKETRTQRPYEQKESARWEQAHRRACERMTNSSHVVLVCDREGDIWELLRYCISGGHRFVLRAAQNRRTTTDKLWPDLESSPVLEGREVPISQRGAQKERGVQNARAARKARIAVTDIRARTLLLKRSGETLQVNAVYVRETPAEPSAEPLEWLLLTSEPIETRAQREQVIQMYEHRWLIEEFHKAWKSGCRLEERPLQSSGAVERMMIVLAAVAIRILRLRTMAEGERATESCEEVLEPDEWQCLWASTRKGEKLPKRPPDLAWAWHALARLGGFMDTKRTGRPGWDTLWRGWQTLQERLTGWRLARNL